MERVDQMHVKDVYRDRKFPFELYYGSKEGMPPTGPVYQHQHWHEALQFTLVNRGSITMQVNGYDYRLTAGEALFINYGFLHALTEISDDGEYISLNFQDKVLSFFPDSRMEERYVLPYITNYALPVTVLRQDEPWQKQVIDTLRQMETIFRDKTAFGREYLLAVRTVELWYHLVQNISHMAERVSDSVLYKQERMREMLTYIHNHYDEDLRVEDIAGAAGISGGECHRAFKTVLHTTPKDYLNQYRLDKSIELLNGSEYSVTEVANMVGYNFTSHFISSFKARFGETPRKYRTRLGRE